MHKVGDIVDGYKCVEKTVISPTHISDKEQVSYRWEKLELTSWNDLKDRPFGEKKLVSLGDTITWDDSLYNGVRIGNDSHAFYKISDQKITIDDLINGIKLTGRDGNYSAVTKNYGYDLLKNYLLHPSGSFGNYGYGFVYINDVSIPASEFQMNVFNTEYFPEPGLYLEHSTGSNYSFNTFTINGFDFKKEIVSAIPTDLLPKAEAVADLTSAPTAENFNALLASLRTAGYLAN